jgi:hypothetical protein
MCIRALDYCPPVDLTFGEYLRALVTADRDLVEDDDLHYRVAFIEAFRRRAIYPRDLRSLSEESLLWRGPEADGYTVSDALVDIIRRLRSYAEQMVYTTSRGDVFNLQRKLRLDVHTRLQKHFATPEGAKYAAYMGLRVARRKKIRFEVRSARVANRIGPDGNMLPQFVIELLQKRPVDAEGANRSWFWGGCTMIADLQSAEIRYCIRKDINSKSREEREAAFHAAKEPSLRDTYFNSIGSSEPFALIHRG